MYSRPPCLSLSLSLSLSLTLSPIIRPHFMTQEQLKEENARHHLPDRCFQRLRGACARCVCACVREFVRACARTVCLSGVCIFAVRVVVSDSRYLGVFFINRALSPSQHKMDVWGQIAFQQFLYHKAKD